MSEFKLEEDSQENENNLPVVQPQKGIAMPLPNGKKYEYEKILNANVETIIEDITSGKSFREIATYFKIPLSSFFEWRRDSKHSARIEAAMQHSSEEDVKKAEDILLEVKDTDSVASVMARKELSQYYRWRAEKRNPKVFGKNLNEEPPALPANNATASQFDEIVKKVLEVANNNNDNNTIDISHVDVSSVPSSGEQI